ncbi:Spy0128 family protein [Brevibacterium samyangense]|uniref:Spy0128 family protein n=1 Tax=Brevibacterium samyangense TaxID=366888 RepID=UPI003CD0BABE
MGGADRNPDFGDLEFTDAGAWSYSVTEQAGTEEGMRYSLAQYQIDIVVTEVNGVLEAEVTTLHHTDDLGETGNTPETVADTEFTNVFTPTPTTGDRPHSCIGLLTHRTTHAPVLSALGHRAHRSREHAPRVRVRCSSVRICSPVRVRSRRARAPARTSRAASSASCASRRASAARFADRSASRATSLADSCSVCARDFRSHSSASERSRTRSASPERAPVGFSPGDGSVGSSPGDGRERPPSSRRFGRTVHPSAPSPSPRCGPSSPRNVDSHLPRAYRLGPSGPGTAIGSSRARSPHSSTPRRRRGVSRVAATGHSRVRT